MTDKIMEYFFAINYYTNTETWGLTIYKKSNDGELAKVGHTVYNEAHNAREYGKTKVKELNK